MKNKKRKGFSLIEILAIIIILALIVMIVVPKIMNTIYDSKNKSLGIVLETTEKWFEKQDLPSNSGLYITYLDIYPELLEKIDTSGSILYDYKETNTYINEQQLKNLHTLEISEKDISQIAVYLFSNGKVCIVAPSIPEESKYYNVKYWIKDEQGYATPNKETEVNYYSDGCKYSPIPQEELLKLPY